jgi:predicted short-subunit dehydrogenase-like oxidoreductase (DUF2520 family)
MGQIKIESIGIAGAGRLAQALGRLLHDRGSPIAAVAGRDLSRTSQAAAFIGSSVRPVALADLASNAGHILICVPDDAIEDVARTLANSRRPIRAALHTSGSRGPEALAALADRGTSCATLHPLQTITTPAQGVADLPGSSFGISGSGESAAWALQICALLDGHALTIAPENRPLYHAAAVMASNYIVASIDAAVLLMGLAGVPPKPAQQALGPLVRASVKNALDSGPVHALTGPIERGDARTVEAHLHALDNAPESVRQLYRQAGLHAIEIARRKAPGIDRGQIESLLRLDTTLNELKP